MPSFKWELFWQQIPPWTSPESIWSFFFPQINSNFDSNLMLSDSVLLLSSLLYSRVVKYHFFFVVFACFWCFWCIHSRVRKCKVCGKNRDARERNLGPIREKLSNLLPCCSRNSSNPDSSSQTRESPGPVGRSFGDVGSVLSTFSRTREFRQRAGLPLTTGKLSGVWERMPAVSAQPAAPTRSPAGSSFLLILTRFGVKKREMIIPPCKWMWHVFIEYVKIIYELWNS